MNAIQNYGAGIAPEQCASSALRGLGGRVRHTVSLPQVCSGFSRRMPHAAGLQ